MANPKSLVIGAASVAVADFGLVSRVLPPSADVAGLPVRGIADGALGAIAGQMVLKRKPDILAAVVQGFAATFAANALGSVLPLPAVGPFNLGRMAAGAAATYGVEMLFGTDAVPAAVAAAV